MYPLGEHLKRLRGDLSLREAAKRSGVSYTYIGSLEKGKHPRTGEHIHPSPETLKSLARAYKTDYEELLRIAGIISTDEKLGYEESINSRNEFIIRELSDKYARLPENKKKIIDDMIDALLNQ